MPLISSVHMAYGQRPKALAFAVYKRASSQTCSHEQCWTARASTKSQKFDGVRTMWFMDTLARNWRETRMTNNDDAIVTTASYRTDYIKACK